MNVAAGVEGGRGARQGQPPSSELCEEGSDDKVTTNGDGRDGCPNISGVVFNGGTDANSGQSGHRGHHE